MKFLAFIIMIVTLESLCLFFFKQTFSIIAMSIITVCGFLCFTAKNWRSSGKFFTYILLITYVIGNISIFSKEIFNITATNNYLFLNDIYIGIITVCSIITFFVAMLVITSYLSNKFQFTNNYNKSSFDDLNPATGLPMMGATDVGGNLFGTQSNIHNDD